MTVDCTQIEQLALDGDLDARRQDPQVRKHLEECEGCRALFAGDGELGHALAEHDQVVDFDQLAPELSAALSAEDESLAGRVRAWPTPWRRAVVMLAGVLVCVAAYAFRRRADFDAYPSARMLAILTGFIVLGCVASWDSLRSLSVPPAPRLRRLLFSIGLGLPFVVALLPEAVTDHPASLSSGHVVRESLVCLAVGIGAAAPALLLWRLADRSSQAISPQRLVVAAFGALFANAALQIHCPLTNIPHLVSGHAFVALLLTAALLLSLHRARTGSD